MSKVVVTKEKLVAIGDAIRSKTETTAEYSLDDMPEVIQGIETGGNGEELAISDASYLFYSGARVSNYDSIVKHLVDVTNMSYMFSKFPDGISVDISTLNTSKVINMSNMFNGAKLRSADFSNFDTSNVTDMSSMFNGCDYLADLNIKNFDTSKVTNMNEMFVGMMNLETLDLSNFDTSNVTNMSSMFAANGKLKNLNISSFNTSKVTTMTYMFNNCNGLKTLDFSNFDTGKANMMTSIFNGCSSLEEITGFSATNKAGLTIGFPKGTTSSRYALRRLTFRTDLPEGTYSIRSAINISYCAFDRAGMVEMFNSLPDITSAGVSANYKKITITGNPCLTDGTLTDEDRAIATNKGWTLVE